MSTQRNPTHNLAALLIGTGEFSFSLGAATLAAATLAGYRDIGNIKAFTPAPDKTEVEHMGSYRGRLVKDRTVATKEQMVYTLQAEEWDKLKLKMLFRGDDTTGHVQAIQTAAIVDTFAFTVGSPAVVGNWYQLTASQLHLMRLTGINLLTSGTGTAVQGEADDEFFTATAHGLVNGNTIVFRGGTAPTGITSNTLYYVVNKTTNTFQVALTAGGSAVTYTTDGTGQSFYPALIEGTDFYVDLELGRIRFTAAQTTTITPTVTAPAITSADANYLFGITPLQGRRFNGYGRLVCFDQDTRNIMYDHRDFSCEVVIDTAGAVNGTDWTDLTIKVIVDSEEPGTVFAREG